MKHVGVWYRHSRRSQSYVQNNWENKLSQAQVTKVTKGQKTIDLFKNLIIALVFRLIQLKKNAQSWWQRQRIHSKIHFKRINRKRKIQKKGNLNKKRRRKKKGMRKKKRKMVMEVMAMKRDKRSSCVHLYLSICIWYQEGKLLNQSRNKEEGNG